MVIIGGGPGGCACALTAVHLGLPGVLLIEAGNYDSFRIGESIPPESTRLLRRLGVLERFKAEGHEPCYGSVSYWGDAKRGYNDSIMSVHGPGRHLDRRRFNAFLADEAERAGATVLRATRFLHAQPGSNGGYRLSLCREASDGARAHEAMDAAMVVDATGVHGVFARARGAMRLEDRPLICLAARFRLADGTVSKLTHLEAACCGWWYAARIGNGTLLTILTTDAATLKAERLHDPKRWRAALAQARHTAAWMAGATPIDHSPRSFPAPSFRLDRAVGRDWAAVGDAASAYDPITSQGIMKAMTDGIEAAHAIAATRAGDGQALERYGAMVVNRYEQYRLMRAYFYGLERRWPDALFWTRMQTAPAAAG